MEKTVFFFNIFDSFLTKKIIDFYNSTNKNLKNFFFEKIYSHDSRYTYFEVVE